MSSTCSTDSLIPTWVTIGFMGCSMIMLFVTSVYSVKFLKGSSKVRLDSSKYNGVTLTAPDDMKPETDALSENKEDEEEEEEEEEEEKKGGVISTTTSVEPERAEPSSVNKEKSQWEKAKGFKKFKIWFFDVWSRKAVYVPLVAHLTDTATDFAAIVEFAQIASKYQSASQCGINIWWLFALSIAAMFVYRLVSSFIIWRITSSAKRVILQLIDIELFEILWLSHRLGLKHKSAPQRLISLLEGIFEAAPQAMIQLIYLLITGNLSGIILLSTILSFVNLTMTIISDDKQFLNIKRTDEDNNVCSCNFLQLYLFRICDIPSHILMYVFLWIVINGYVLSVVAFIDVVVAVYCYKKTKDVEALTSMVAMPFDLSDVGVLEWFVRYSFVRCIAVITAIWIGIAINGWTAGGELWIFCFIASIFKYCLYRCLTKSHQFSMKQKAKERSNVVRLLDLSLYDDAMSLIFYLNMNFEENVKKIHGNSHRGRYSLLAIAAGSEQNTELFSYILNTYGLDINLNDENQPYRTALMMAAETGNKEYMKRIIDVADWDYIQKRDDFTGTALPFLLKRSDNYYVMSHYLECIDDKIENDKDYNDKKIALLNSCARYNRTALHVTVVLDAELDSFGILLKFYPEYYQQEALQKEDEDRNTALDLAKKGSFMADFIVSKQKSFANK